MDTNNYIDYRDMNRCFIHVVKKGDTLYVLSKLYGVDLGRIIMANPYVNVYNMQVGDEVCIPIRRMRDLAYDNNDREDQDDVMENGDTNIGNEYRRNNRNDNTNMRDEQLGINRPDTLMNPSNTDRMREYDRRGDMNPIEDNDNMQRERMNDNRNTTSGMTATDIQNKEENNCNLLNKYYNF